jgi:signal peptidase II
MTSSQFSQSFRRIGFTIALIAFAMDQASKTYIIKLLAAHAGAITLTPFLNFITAWNRGISFSLFASSGDANRWILVGLTGGLCLIVGSFLYHAATRLHAIGYGCILGGAIGNLADRIHFGAVFDFIDLHLYNWHFYTFNGADKFITLGVILILGDYLYTAYKQNHRQEP